MSLPLPILDPSWLLLAGVATLAFALPILSQIRRLGADVLEDTSTLITSHVSFLACAFLGYRFTGLRGGIALLAIWGALSATVHLLGVWLTPHGGRVTSPTSPPKKKTSPSHSRELSKRPLRLHVGWNLVSNPLRLLNDQPEKVLGAGAVFWAWNAAEQTYERPDHLTLGMAIWIHSMTERSLELYGYTPESFARRLHPGWNLVGPILRIEAPRSSSISGSTWGFERQKAVSADELLPGRGYWIFAREFVDLRI